MPSICFTCKITTHCKKCANCLLIKYCSKECQLNDYTEHKLKCKDYKKICIYLKDRQMVEDYNKYKIKKIEECETSIHSCEEIPLLLLPPLANILLHETLNNNIDEFDEFD